IQNMSNTRNRFSKDPPVNSYSILGYKYNTSEFPRIQFGANSDDGFIAGAGFATRTYGFRNDPYATDQKFGIYHSFNNGSFRFSYNGEFNHITRDIDLVVKGRLGLPEVNNFFGFGNTTTIDENMNYDFYKVKFKLAELQVLFRQRFFERLHVMVGPYYMHYANRYSQNDKKILGNPSIDSAHIYSNKDYLGAKLAMNFDNTNNDVFPTRGVHWENELVSAAGITNTSKTFTKFNSDMTIYASLSDPAKLIGVVSFGGSRIFSKSFEFFQAVAIGNNKLHGFRANRYLGKSTLYGSMELRYKLFNLRSYIIPGPVGLTGFYDIGRVWLDGENSKRWHSAYGGGFYFVPYNKFMISGSIGFTGNENMFTLVLGTKINLSF
ncbi:MAG TPA: BamA/TamA family outer membrane protein, partial [Chitinophagaceae bacterium]